LQALTLLNDTVFVECSQALGKFIIDKKQDAKSRLRFAFGLCLGRDPSATELDRLSRLHEELVQSYRAKPEAAAKLLGKMKIDGVDSAEAAAWVVVARTLMNLDEFVTRE